MEKEAPIIRQTRWIGGSTQSRCYYAPPVLVGFVVELLIQHDYRRVFDLLPPPGFLGIRMTTTAITLQIWTLFCVKRKYKVSTVVYFVRMKLRRVSTYLDNVRRLILGITQVNEKIPKKTHSSHLPPRRCSHGKTSRLFQRCLVTLRLRLVGRCGEVFSKARRDGFAKKDGDAFYQRHSRGVFLAINSAFL
jgi:hypothetical protein